MKRDTEVFSDHIWWRVYSLSLISLSSASKDYIRKDTRISVVLEANINYHQKQLRIKIKIESLSGDNSQFWVRISNELIKFVKDLIGKSRIRTKNRTNLQVRDNPDLENWESNLCVLKKNQIDQGLKQNWSRSQSSFISFLWNTFRFMKEDDLRLNWIRAKYDT